jgi:hypothetical protein
VYLEVTRVAGAERLALMLYGVTKDDVPPGAIITGPCPVGPISCGRHDLGMEDEDISAVRSALHHGASLDGVAKLLIEDRHLRPIPAIKALRAGAEITLLSAKEAVHRNLPEPVRRAAEQLWDEAETAVPE